MSYVEKTLSKDEVIEEDLRMHWIVYLGPITLATFLLFITIVMSASRTELNWIIIAWMCVIYSFIKLFFVEMIVTNKRVVYKSGIIATHTEELKNAKIESVEIRQGILDRLLGTGDIYFSGTGTSKIIFYSIDHPWEVKGRIEYYIGD